MAQTGAVEGLVRSDATARDRARRRVLALTTVAGVTGVAAVGGLIVALVPDGAGRQASVVRPAADPVTAAGGTAQQQQQPPVATSGGS